MSNESSASECMVGSLILDWRAFSENLLELGELTFLHASFELYTKLLFGMIVSNSRLWCTILFNPTSNRAESHLSTFKRSHSKDKVRSRIEWTSFTRNWQKGMNGFKHSRKQTSSSYRVTRKGLSSVLSYSLECWIRIWSSVHKPICTLLSLVWLRTAANLEWVDLRCAALLKVLSSISIRVSHLLLTSTISNQLLRGNSSNFKILKVPSPSSSSRGEFPSPIRSHLVVLILLFAQPTSNPQCWCQSYCRRIYQRSGESNRSNLLSIALLMFCFAGRATILCAVLRSQSSRNLTSCLHRFRCVQDERFPRKPRRFLCSAAQCRSIRSWPRLSYQWSTCRSFDRSRPFEDLRGGGSFQVSSLRFRPESQRLTNLRFVVLLSDIISRLLRSRKRQPTLMSPLKHLLCRCRFNLATVGTLISWPGVCVA